MTNKIRNFIEDDIQLTLYILKQQIEFMYKKAETEEEIESVEIYLQSKIQELDKELKIQKIKIVE